MTIIPPKAITKNHTVKVSSPLRRTTWVQMESIFLTSRKPVSYTHLTVMPEEIQSPEMTADWETKLLLVPVSYTHLDVYKRQVLRNGEETFTV